MEVRTREKEKEKKDNDERFLFVDQLSTCYNNNNKHPNEIVNNDHQVLFRFPLILQQVQIVTTIHL